MESVYTIAIGKDRTFESLFSVDIVIRGFPPPESPRWVW